MTRKVSQSDPALAIEFFLSGFYTHRSQLFAPFKQIGINVVSFHDPVIDGANMEDTDLYEWQRRPGFSIFCPIPLADSEIANQFYSSRNLNGQVSAWVDTTQRLALFTDTSITTVATKSTTSQGFINTIGNVTYFSDGSPADLYVWDGTNLSTWGLAPPTIAPVIDLAMTELGFWQPYVVFALGNSILDTNGCVETVTDILSLDTSIGGTGTSGKNEPIWNTLVGGPVSDGGLRWTNYGPIQTWYPVTNYPTPIVILDPNGFLQLGSQVGTPISTWLVGTPYTVIGTVVSFAGSYWTNVFPGTNLGVAPSAIYTHFDSGTGITTPYWVQTSSPIVTGDIAPVWNTTVGGTTLDGSYSWTNIGHGTGLAFTGYSYVYAYRTIYGHLTTGSPFSANTGAILGPVHGSITGFSITSNVVTFQGTNNFLPGNIFEVSGLTSPVGVLLNGKSFTIISAIPSESFPLTFVAASGTVVTITALNNLAVGGGQQVTFSGVGSAAWLNGLTVTTTAATGTQFTFANTHGAMSAGAVGLVNVGGSYTAAFAYSGTAAYPSDVGESLPLIASLSGPSCASPLCNSVANITAVKVIANVVTLTASNNFQPGLWITIEGLSNAGTPNASFLNGQQLQVIAVDQPVGTQNTWFQVYFENPNYPNTADAGTVTFNAVEIYRVSDGGGTYLFDGAVTNPTVVPLSHYDSLPLLAGAGADNGVPGTNIWLTPNNVTSVSAYATATFNYPAPGGGGTFGVVQSVTAQGHYVYSILSGNYSNGPASISATLSNPVAAGNKLLCIVASGDEPINGIPSDTQTNLYLSVVTEVMNTTLGTGMLYCYLVETPTPGATTVTVNVTPSTSEVVMVLFLEVQGLVPLSSVDVFASATGTGTTFNTGSVTTSNSPDIIITAIYQEQIGAVPPAVDTPLASITVTAADAVPGLTGGTYQLSSAWESVTTPAPYSSIWTGTASQPAWGITVALKSKAIAASDGLDATTFPISVPAGVTPQGIQITFDALYSGNTADAFISVQLLKDGNPWGNPKTIVPTGSVLPYTLGSATDLWGGVWTASDFTPDTNWGVRFIGVQYPQTGGPSFTFSIRKVKAEVFGASGLDVWVFNDFVPDANLDILLVAPLYHQNDPPPGGPGSLTFVALTLNPPNIPTTGTMLTYWNGRLWQVKGNYVYFDAGPDCTNGIPEHSWPPGNRFQFAGPVLGTEPTADGVGLQVFLADRTNAILGGPETISFYPTDFLSNFGISNPNAIFRDGSIIGLFTTQRQYFELVGVQKMDIGEHIADYLTANFTAVKTYATTHRNGLDVGTFISNGVDQVLRYGSNVPAWSVPAYPACGAGALRSIETSVGVNTLMLAAPTGGTTVTNSNPQLGAAIGYALLAYSGITNTGGTIIIGGNIGSGPTTAITGFPPGMFALPAMVDQTNVTAAHTAAVAAYAYYTGLTFTSLGTAVNLATSGNGANTHTYLPGKYSSISSFDIPNTSGGIVLDAQGDSNALFIFWAASTVTLESGSIISLINGAKAVNVIWIVGSSFTSIATSTMVGTILAQISITLGGGSLTGRAIAGIGGSSGAVTISAATAITATGGAPSEVGKGNYLYARDINSWGDGGTFGANNGVPNPLCNVVIGSITLSQLGAPLMALQHVVGYFNAVGTLQNGGPSQPNIWVLPNEVNDTQGVGFVQLPEVLQEPPTGQNHPSKSLLALRWPVNMVNSFDMSQYIHHLQLKIQFEPENAPNTIKAIAFKSDQD